ncbi:hypothetical protein DAI22_01g190700 [Oryza sativa Japonica Group]|nr:hypothetical protein DAI22_01g190700 [Oryza sativa Japonica Group]
MAEAAGTRASQQQEEAAGIENGGGKDQLPEDTSKLNITVLWLAIYFRLMDSFGKLALAWATVVLLGGFSTLIKPKDFWFVTIIVVMQITRVFGGSQKPEDQLFIRVPLSMLHRDELTHVGLGSWRKNTIKNGEASKGSSSVRQNQRNVLVRMFCPKRHVKMTIFQTTLTWMEAAALVACIFISFRRLLKQDYVDPKDKVKDDHKNIRGSLNVFYGLALAHSMSYYILIVAFQFLVAPLVRLVHSSYKLHDWGMDAVSEYTAKKLWAFIRYNVREALEMNLITFGKELARSDSIDDQLKGVRILDYIIRWEKQHLSRAGVLDIYKIEKYKGRVLTSIRASTETLERVVNMLGLNLKSLEEEETRGHAASIVLELAPYLLFENLPAMPQLIASLLTTGRERINEGPHDINSVELTCYGVKILERLVENPDNRRSVADANVVLSKIVELLNFRDDCKVPVPDETENRSQEEIVEASLNVLHKLVSTTGETGEALRSTISKNSEIMSNIRKILYQHDNKNSSLSVHAVKILSCLAMHETAREVIGSSCQIVRKLVSSVLPRPMDIVQDGNNGSTVADSAAQALVLLSTGSEYNRATILDKINLEELVGMLFDASMEQRIMIAHLLKHLRTYSGPGYGNQLKKVIDGSLPKLLEEIKVAVQKLDNPEFPDGQPSHDLKELKAEEGKLLDSFIGLSSQICHSLQAIDFDKALQSANLTMDTYAQDGTERVQISYHRFPGDKKSNTQSDEMADKK